MKHFWKVTGSLFGKLVVARIFGLILSFTILLALSGTIGSVLTQFCAAMLIVVLLFTTAWEQGSKDANMIAIHRLKEDRWLGLKAGLTASLPDLVAAVLLLLSKSGIVNNAFSVLYGIYNASFLPFHQALLPQTLTAAEHSWLGYILSASTVLLAPLCAAFGYRLGLYQLSLSDTLLYTTPESRQRHEMKRKAKKGKRGLFRS